MARRKGSIDRDALREKLIAIAEALVLQGGPEALTARALATHLGYSLGHIYNLVDDLNELILLVNARTLAQLHETLCDAADEASSGQRLLAIATAYLEFCQTNKNMWALVMTYQHPQPDTPLPEFYAAQVAALPALVGGELKALFPQRSNELIRRDVAVLWSALQGINALASSQRLDLIGAPAPALLAKHLLENYLNLLSPSKASSRQKWH